MKSKPRFSHPQGLVSLDAVSHYHQAPGRDPVGQRIAHYHECIEVVTGGRGWVEDGPAWREVRPGDLLWHRPGDSTIGRSDWDHPYRCLAVRITVEPKNGRDRPRFSFWPDLESLWLFTREVTSAFLDDGFDRQVLAGVIESRLLFQIHLHTREGARESFPPGLREVLQVLEQDYARPHHVPDLARRAGWSAAHFQERFRQCTGTTPHQWLLARRLRAAKERLVNTSDPVKQIAVECGFADTATLGHAFKKRTGRSPAEYRRVHRHTGSHTPLTC
jgi:AraC-like DNA-binding protein